MPCKCNTAKRDPECTTGHHLSEIEVAIAFPDLDRGPSNPNPMKAPCGQEDCGHTIEKLVAALAEVEKGIGAFSRDPLQFACNTIDDMKDIARAAIKEAK